MIDIEQLETDLHAILEPVVQAVDPDAILIIEPNNAPAPSTSYATMKLASMEKSGFTIMGELDNNGFIPIRAEYDIAWAFSSFGSNAKNINANLHFAVTDNPLIGESLDGIGLYQFNTPVITDIPLFVSGQTWEDRSNATVQFHYAYEQLVDIGYIETLTLNGDYYNVDDTLALQTNNTISLT